jgi:hypothetical protein
MIYLSLIEKHESLLKADLKRISVQIQTPGATTSAIVMPI